MFTDRNVKCAHAKCTRYAQESDVRNTFGMCPPCAKWVRTMNEICNQSIMNTMRKKFDVCKGCLTKERDPQHAAIFQR